MATSPEKEMAAGKRGPGHLCLSRGASEGTGNTLEGRGGITPAMAWPACPGRSPAGTAAFACPAHTVSDPLSLGSPSLMHGTPSHPSCGPS